MRVDQVSIVGNPQLILPVRSVIWPVNLGTPPRRAAGFQPRVQAQEIFGAWESEGPSPRLEAAATVLITGPAGVGKTQLAANVYENAASMGTDLLMWVKAESRTSVVTAFAVAAERVQASVPEGANTDQKAAAFLDWLSVTDRPWLMVLDNASDPVQLSGLWPRGRGRVLATTYRQDAGLLIGAVTTVQLGVFTASEANSYIEGRVHEAGRNGVETKADVLDEASDLARDLGYLPVALAQAISVILYKATCCSDYRTDFADRTSRLSELFPDPLPADEYGRTVATTWSLALEQADSMIPKGLASCIAQLIAATDPSGAPEAVFLAEPSLAFLSTVTPEDESADTPSSSSLLTPAKARLALRNLHTLSLIDHQPYAPATVRMHRLAQRAVREVAQSGCIEVAVGVVADSLTAIWAANERDGRTLLLSNAEHVIRASADALWNDRPHPLLYQAGSSMLEAGMVGAAIQHFQWLGDQNAIRLGPHEPDTLTSKDYLAIAYRDAGNLSVATTLFEQTLSDRERVLGREHPRTLATRSNLAGAYLDAGKLARGGHLLEQTLSDVERVRGNDHPDTLTARSNLAIAYREAGNLAGAVKLWEQNVADRERVLGSDHQDTLFARNQLAGAYLASGNLAGAIELFGQSLTEVERVLGEDHPRTLTARNNLAGAYVEAGDLVRAAQLLEQSLTEVERVLGMDHPHTLTVRNNLAGVHLDTGNLPRAAQLFKQTLTDRERVLGEDHPDTMSTRGNLAAVYRDAGNLVRATKLFEQVLVDAERVLGNDHPATLGSRINLADAYRRAGNLADAIKLNEQTRIDVERILGNDHPDTLTARNNLAGAYQDAGNLTEAIKLFEQTVADRERLLGKVHPHTLGSRNNLAVAYLRAGNLAAAIKLLEHTLLDAERVLGKEHPHTLTARANLAKVNASARRGLKA